jgi:hypothetical protein
MSANGNVPAGAIKETEQAKKVWLCLNSTKAGVYLLYDTARRAKGFQRVRSAPEGRRFLIH